jgi:hypothetical protein
MVEHFTGGTPEKVAILGCGPTMQDYVSIMASAQANDFHVDEVWGINAAGRVLQTDMDFMMDDYAMFRGRPENTFTYIESDIGKPLVTSVPRSCCPNAVAYPLAEVLSIPGARAYLNHTAAYAVAYAILIGVKEICIFGCDYISASKPYGHAGSVSDWPYRYMACMAFWSGIAAARGINVIVTPNSPFLDSDSHSRKRFYGYLVAPIVKHEGA